jgi:hypothetical protein
MIGDPMFSILEVLIIARETSGSSRRHLAKTTSSSMAIDAP